MKKNTRTAALALYFANAACAAAILASLLYTQQLSKQWGMGTDDCTLLSSIHGSDDFPMGVRGLKDGNLMALQTFACIYIFLGLAFSMVSLRGAEKRMLKTDKPATAVKTMADNKLMVLLTMGAMAAIQWLIIPALTINPCITHDDYADKYLTPACTDAKWLCEKDTLAEGASRMLAVSFAVPYLVCELISNLISIRGPILSPVEKGCEGQPMLGL